MTEVKSRLDKRSFPVDKPLVDLCQATPDFPPPAQPQEPIKKKPNDPRACTYNQDEGLRDVRAVIYACYVRRYFAGPKPGEICLITSAVERFKQLIGKNGQSP